MKLWISGEVDSIVGDYFRNARNFIEKRINQIISNKDYGSGILNWDVIVMVTQEGGKEIFKYDYKNKETNIYLVLDFHKFKSCEVSDQQRQLLDALIYCVDKLINLNIADFNAYQLKEDLLRLKESIFK